MALSQKDLLRRIKQKVNIKIGASSPVQGSSSHKEPESGPEITIREPTLKKRKVVSGGNQPPISETSDSIDSLPDNTEIRKATVTSSRKSFWDEDFEHIAHGRAHNFSATDDVILSKQVSNSTREGLLRYLHQAEASSLFLVNRLEALELKESSLIREIEASKKEMTQLRSDAAELVKIRQVLKDKEIELGGKETELATLKVKVDELTPKMETYETQVQELAEKCKKLENEKEEMADQLCTTLNQGFQLALNQIKVLCLDADISGADITKEVVDGQLVEITDD